MIRKVVTLQVVLFFVLLCLVFGSTVSANSVTKNDEGIIQDGRTLVPLRAIFETLGASVEWKGATQTIVATRGNDKIVLVVGSRTTNVNGKSVLIDVPATIFNGRTFVPLRFVSEALGADVQWDSNKLLATIESNNKVMEVYASSVMTKGTTSIVYRNNQMGFLFLLNKQVADLLVAKQSNFVDDYQGQRIVESVSFYYKDKTHLRKDVWSLEISKYTANEWNNFYREGMAFSLVNTQDGWVFAILQPGEHPYMFDGYNVNHREAKQFVDTHYKLVDAIEKTIKVY
ncbi:stalk domain-containing protein [Anaerobacillus sp. MEB173]|uniref:stalk domain-containing protein n=1 Tax=Anaerobacillus sp. MEB173 TaxID=3383345 RepID=UPI003F9046F0